jgi:fused-like protein
VTHADEDFLIQFCDAVAILNATTLLQQFLLLGRRKVRVVTDLVAILSHVLRVLPENAGLIDQIVLGMDKVGKLNFSMQLKEASVIIVLCILDFTAYLYSMPHGNSASVIIT